jgi:transposase
MNLAIQVGFMGAKPYTEKFRIKAVKQLADRRHPVAEVASRLGMTGHSLRQWVRRYRVPGNTPQVSGRLK